MAYEYKTIGVCPSKITFTLDGDVVHDVEFKGGCNGNSKALSILTNGMTVNEIEEKLRGIRCEQKCTSCADQLALAVRQSYEASNTIYPSKYR